MDRAFMIGGAEERPRCIAPGPSSSASCGGFAAARRSSSCRCSFPIVQLVVLGYAFGGIVKHLQAGRRRSGPRHVRRAGARAVQRRGRGRADVRTRSSTATRARRWTTCATGGINGVLTIPPDFSRRALEKAAPRVGADRGQHRHLRGRRRWRHRWAAWSRAFNQPPPDDAPRPGQATLDAVEVYPYVPYIQYLLPGSIVMSIFMMVMIGGGIIFIDDKARGLHEGYLVTPITKFELIAGFNLSGTIKAVLAGRRADDHRVAHRRHPQPVRAAAPAQGSWS